MLPVTRWPPSTGTAAPNVGPEAMTERGSDKMCFATSGFT